MLVEERPEPELIERDDAIVRVEATGVCGSDLGLEDAVEASAVYDRREALKIVMKP